MLTFLSSFIGKCAFGVVSGKDVQVSGNSHYPKTVKVLAAESFCTAPGQCDSGEA
jgi:hypothetical protein